MTLRLSGAIVRMVRDLGFALQLLQWVRNRANSRDVAEGGSPQNEHGVGLPKRPR